jgi:ribosomal-protein-alanine N-acetyltransferase
MNTWRQAGPANYFADDQELQVRLARSEDLPELESLDLEVFGDLAYQFFVLRQLFDIHRDCWLIAENSNGMQGYSLGVPSTDRTAGWIMGLAVRSTFRRTGCGRILTAACLRKLRSQGVRTVYLTVDPNNGAALGLYRKMGFVSEEYIPNYFGNGQHRLLLVRELKC